MCAKFRSNRAPGGLQSCAVGCHKGIPRPCGCARSQSVCLGHRSMHWTGRIRVVCARYNRAKMTHRRVFTALVCMSRTAAPRPPSLSSLARKLKPWILVAAHITPRAGRSLRLIVIHTNHVSTDPSWMASNSISCSCSTTRRSGPGPRAAAAAAPAAAHHIMCLQQRRAHSTNTIRSSSSSTTTIMPSSSSSSSTDPGSRGSVACLSSTWRRGGRCRFGTTSSASSR